MSIAGTPPISAGHARVRQSWGQRLRHRLKPIALYFTRSSHRELLTRTLAPRVATLRGVIIDIGGGRDSPLAGFWNAATRRVRLDLSPRFAPNVLADAQRLPLPDDAVDGAFISEVLEHIPRPNLAIAEIHRVLRPGALICGSVPFSIGLHADPHDYYRYTAEALELLLEDFSEIEVRPHGNHLGAAWRALNSRWKWLWVFNPMVRPLCRRTDPRWPVGYTFVARKRS